MVAVGVGAGERQQPDLLVAGLAQAVLDHVGDARDAALAHWSRDHSCLAETASARAAAEDLDAHALMHCFRERHEGRLRVRPGIEIHQGELAHAPRDIGFIGHDALDATVFEVLDVVEARHVDHAGQGKPAQEADTALGAAFALPVAHDVSDEQYGLFTITHHSSIDELGNGLGIKCCVAAGDDDRVLIGAISSEYRNAGEINRREHVRVTKLGRERHAHDIEVTECTMAIDSELRHLVLAHQLLEIGPHRIGTLGQSIVALVDHFVEDLHALIGSTHLVGIGVHECPVNVDRLPRLLHRIEFAAHVLNGLRHERQERLETFEH